MKRSVALVVCAAVLAVAMASFAKQPKTEVPALVATARFVHVTTYYGTSPADGRISAQARAAVAQVEDAVRDWGRYQLTMNARDADIILLVRPAARASVMAGRTIGIGTDRRPQIGGTAGVEVSSSADDMLAVYSGTPGIDSAPLWRRTSANGFGSDMALFKAFKKAVEDSTAALKAPKSPSRRPVRTVELARCMRPSGKRAPRLKPDEITRKCDPRHCAFLGRSPAYSKVVE